MKSFQKLSIVLVVVVGLACVSATPAMAQVTYGYYPGYVQVEAPSMYGPYVQGVRTTYYMPTNWQPYPVRYYPSYYPNYYYTTPSYYYYRPLLGGRRFVTGVIVR